MASSRWSHDGVWRRLDRRDLERRAVSGAATLLDLDDLDCYVFQPSSFLGVSL